LGTRSCKSDHAEEPLRGEEAPKDCTKGVPEAPGANSNKSSHAEAPLSGKEVTNVNMQRGHLGKKRHPNLLVNDVIRAPTRGPLFWEKKMQKRLLGGPIYNKTRTRSFE
jgi:hypothetical protein